MNTCPVCGRQFDTGGIIQLDEPHYLLCDNCGVQFYTCFSCANARKCAFQENPNHLPPVINKVVQQGNMRMQTQAPNPDLIAETCQAGCPCWFDQCCKTNGASCVNYALDTTMFPPRAEQNQ